MQTEISKSNKNSHLDFVLFSFKIIIFIHPVQVFRDNSNFLSPE